MSNSKKVIVITGASQGLGDGMVKAFRELGYRIVATSRSIKPSTDPDIHTVAGDIGEPATAQRVIREAIERFGRVDTLINNAGIFIAKPFTAYTAEDYANVLSVNVNGFFYITQLAIAEMEKQGSGHVVGDQIKINAVDGAGFVTRLGGVLDPAHFGAAADDHVGLLQASGIADHQRATLLVDDVVGQALHDDFRADTRSVAHGDADDGEVVAHSVHSSPWIRVR
jgi:hypothetical protein